MSGTCSLLIAGNIAALALLVVFLFRQFRYRLESERMAFEKNQGSENHEDTELFR